MLTSKLELHDLHDTEAFCQAIIVRARLDLRPHQQDDLLAYLIAEAWALSQRFQPQGFPFSQWARPTLQRRVQDWLRLEFGRTRWTFHDRVYERPRPTLVSLDDPGYRELGPAHPGGLGHVTPDRSPDLVRVLRPGGGEADGVDGGSGERAA